MSDRVLQAWIWQQTVRAALRERLVPDERGEGVISMAIGVLIMAFLGVIMWKAFQLTMGNAQQSVDDQVGKIGQ